MEDVIYSNILLCPTIFSFATLEIQMVRDEICVLELANQEQSIQAAVVVLVVSFLVTRQIYSMATTNLLWREIRKRIF
jgi:hypothetical protein